MITHIPAGALPSGLTVMDFEENPITSIDQKAFEGSEDTLTELKFSGGHFEELPLALLYLNKLAQFSVRNNPIDHWSPDIMYHMGDTLQTLTLVNVGLTAWPSWIEYLPHISVLELSSAVMSVPDDAFHELTQTLRSVTMENITLTSTGHIFSNISTLQDLTLNNNNISKVLGLPNFHNLTNLSMKNNTISDGTLLSDALRQVADSVRTLYLDMNRLTVLPDLSFISQLETLSLSQNVISTTDFGFVPASVTVLGLESNKIATLASFMRNATKLNVVRLHSNSVTELRGIDLPSSVSDMDISYNLVTQLTEMSFPQNSNMATLNFDSNPLARVSPSAFLNTPRLTQISAKNTKLTRLPLALVALDSLTQVDLTDNTHLVCTCLENSFSPWMMSYSVVISGNCGEITIVYFLKTLSSDCPS